MTGAFIRRMARSACNGRRAQVHGHRAHGLSLAFCQPTFRQLQAHVGSWPVDLERTEHTGARDLAGTGHEILDRSFLYDSTNPAARDYIWEQVEKNYHKAGIRSSGSTPANPR